MWFENCLQVAPKVYFMNSKTRFRNWRWSMPLRSNGCNFVNLSILNKAQKPNHLAFPRHHGGSSARRSGFGYTSQPWSQPITPEKRLDQYFRSLETSTNRISSFRMYFIICSIVNIQRNIPGEWMRPEGVERVGDDFRGITICFDPTKIRTEQTDVKPLFCRNYFHPLYPRLQM